MCNEHIPLLHLTIGTAITPYAHFVHGQNVVMFLHLMYLQQCYLVLNIKGFVSVQTPTKKTTVKYPSIISCRVNNNIFFTTINLTFLLVESGGFIANWKHCIVVGVGQGEVSWKDKIKYKNDCEA
jgi:hypothetical protein